MRHRYARFYLSIFSRRSLCSWSVSLVVHGLGLVTLLALAYQPWWLDARVAWEARSIHVSWSERTETGTEPPVAPDVQFVSDPEQVTADMVRERIDERIGESEARSDAENLQRLDELAERLSGISSKSSIDAMTDAFHSLMGTQSRATEPAAEPIGGDFDSDSAQFHDVHREPRADGSFEYFAVLIDANGRITEVSMNAADGERLYVTMQKIKENPLLERVYRRMMMPLLDQMLAADRDLPSSKQASPKTSAPETLPKQDDQSSPDGSL